MTVPGAVALPESYIPGGALGLVVDSIFFSSGIVLNGTTANSMVAPNGAAGQNGSGLGITTGNGGSGNTNGGNLTLTLGTGSGTGHPGQYTLAVTDTTTGGSDTTPLVSFSDTFAPSVFTNKSRQTMVLTQTLSGPEANFFDATTNAAGNRPTGLFTLEVIQNYALTTSGSPGLGADINSYNSPETGALFVVMNNNMPLATDNATSFLTAVSGKVGGTGLGNSVALASFYASVNPPASIGNNIIAYNTDNFGGTKTQESFIGLAVSTYELNGTATDTFGHYMYQSYLSIPSMGGNVSTLIAITQIQSNTSYGGCTQITTASAHGFYAGKRIWITGSGTTPSADGQYSVGQIIDVNNFVINKVISAGTTNQGVVDGGRNNENFGLYITATLGGAGGAVSGSGTNVGITGTTAANPTTVTTAANHGLQVGAVIFISGNTTPADGSYTVVTTPTPTTFTLNVLGGGSGGTVYSPSNIYNVGARIDMPTNVGGPIYSNTYSMGIWLNDNSIPATNAGNFYRYSIFSASLSPSQFAGPLTLWYNNQSPAVPQITSPNNVLFVLASKTVTSAAGLNWRAVHFDGGTLTLTGGANSGGSSGLNYFQIEQPSISAASALTVALATTQKIRSTPNPTGAGPATITNAAALMLGDTTTTVLAYNASNATTITTAAMLWISNSPATGGNVTVTNGYAIYINAGDSLFQGALTLSPAALAGGESAFTITPGAHTAVTAEVTDLLFNAHTATTTGSYAVQRATRFAVPTYTSAGAFTITTAATVAIDATPNPTGAGPQTITNAAGLLIGTSATAVAAYNASNATTIALAASLWIANAPATAGNVTVTNGYSIYVNAGDVRFSANAIVGTRLTVGSTSVSANATLVVIGNGEYTTGLGVGAAPSASALVMADGFNVSIGTTTGTMFATSGGASGPKMGWWGSTPAVQPLFATGAGHTVDQLITQLQNMGLMRQS